MSMDDEGSTTSRTGARATATQKTTRVSCMMEEIAEFTDLGNYLAMPVHTYSSGMRLRLALAASTCFDPEILLMDEWIGMGDAHFLEKAEGRMDRFVGRSSILVIASHSETLIKRLCNKAVLLDRGEVAAAGTVDEVVTAYRTSSTPPAERTTVEQSEVPE